MVILIIIALTIFFVITWLLLVPIRVILNSDDRILEIKVFSIGSIAAALKDNSPVIRLKGFFLQKEIPFSDLGKKQKKEEPKKEPEKKGAKKKKVLSAKKRKWILRLTRIPRAFRVVILNISIDSGDYIMNAYLFPVFGLLNNYKPDWALSVNYLGENKIYLKLQSSLIRIIYVYLK